MDALVDTGPLFALVDSDDCRHNECLQLFQSFRGTLYVPQLVISEVSGFLTEKLGLAALAGFLADLLTGNFIPEPVAPADWARILQLVIEYRDLRLGTIDASVVAAAERMGISTIISLDGRHFSAVQPIDGRPFQLLP